MSLFPIILVGAAAYYFGKRKKKKEKKQEKRKALPPAEERGTVFPAGEVDVIEAKAGERFTVSMSEVRGTAYSWSLAASPPDNTIELVKEEREGGTSGMGGGSEDHLFIFKAKKAGSGALVFHYMRGFEKGQAPPDKVLEIQTKVS